MNIDVHVREKVKTVSVIGGVEEYSEVERFKKAVMDDIERCDRIEITFFNAHIIPADIIELISPENPLFKNKVVKIYSLSRTLFSYLSKLGINTAHVATKSLVHSRKYKEAGYLAIGGSAESTDKIFKIVKDLPLCDRTLFIVQHVIEDQKNILADLLQNKTDYNVVSPVNGTIVEKQTIYIAPSGHHMIVKDGIIHLTKDEPYNYARPSIDILFNSLATEYKENLVSVILCGYGVDGIESLDILSKNSSMIIIEDPNDCSADLLPKRAINRGNYSNIMNIDNMIRYIRHLFSDEEDLDKDIDLFLDDVYQKYKFDFRGYQKNSLKRRVKNFLTVEQIPTFHEFELEVLENEEMFEKFFLEFTVNVTSFFRDPQVFMTLRDVVIPHFKDKNHIKIWSAGCSTGEEPYSLAIMLDEMGLLDRTYIYATDLNDNVVKQAINGLFPKKMLDEDIENYNISGGRESFLDYIDVEKNYIKIKDFLKERILFFSHTLTAQGILNEFDIILCRNVIIYFNRDLQKQVFRLFRNSMDESSFLVLGETENIVTKEIEEHFKMYDKKSAVYRPKGDLNG